MQGQVRAMLEEQVQARAIAGAVAVVARDDETEFVTAGVQDLEAGTPMGEDTIFRIMSMTKPVTAALAMILVEDGTIALDDPAERFLPELTGRRVMRTPETSLEDTVPAERPITVEDLLTLRCGIGWVHSGPLADAMRALGVAPGPEVPFTPDEFIARIARLPLASQPGWRWLYHTGADILCVLLARAAHTSLETLLQERLFQPLGMADTGFHVPEKKLDRLATAYRRGPDGRLAVADPARGGAYSAAPVFPSELVSTADDYLRFARMLLRGGAPVLSADSVRRMMRDHISPEQKAVSPFFPGFWDDKGWGYGGAVVTRGSEHGPAAGSYGWDGGYGTSFTIDPVTGTVTILLLQREMRSPDDLDVAEALRRIAFTHLNPATL